MSALGMRPAASLQSSAHSPCVDPELTISKQLTYGQELRAQLFAHLVHVRLGKVKGKLPQAMYGKQNYKHTTIYRWPLSWQVIPRPACMYQLLALSNRTTDLA